MARLSGSNGKITSWVRKNAHRDTGFSYLIQFIYCFFSSSIIQAVISVLGTVIIALLIAKDKVGLVFWIVVAIYAILIVLTTWADRYTKAKVRDTKVFQNALYGISAVLRSWAVEILRWTEKAIASPEKKAEFIAESADFQAAAYTVCANLKDFLTRESDLDDVYVTIFQREMFNGENTCRMIAYSGTHEPTSFGTRYTIPAFSAELYGRIEYHTYVFSSGSKDILVLTNHKDVEAAFRTHVGSESREKSIQQYICVPIAPPDQGTLFLLQVDTKVPYLFGENSDSVIEFAQNTVYPFAQFLHMIYERARSIELIK